MSESHTTVVTTQVTRSEGRVMTTGNREWTTGIFKCHEDIKICLCGLCVPCCYSCQLATKMGESCLVPCFVPGGIIAMRTKLRMMLGIQGTICNDCIMTNFCGLCALCQMGREMKHAGFN